MELATITTKGQITIPRAIRTKFHLKKGDKILFHEENGRVYFMNASVLALNEIQQIMQNKTQDTDLQSPESVNDFIAELR